MGTMSLPGNLFFLFIFNPDSNIVVLLLKWPITFARSRNYIFAILPLQGKEMSLRKHTLFFYQFPEPVWGSGDETVTDFTLKVYLLDLARRQINQFFSFYPLLEPVWGSGV